MPKWETLLWMMESVTSLEGVNLASEILISNSIRGDRIREFAVNNNLSSMNTNLEHHPRPLCT